MYGAIQPLLTQLGGFSTSDVPRGPVLIDRTTRFEPLDQIAFTKYIVLPEELPGSASGALAGWTVNAAPPPGF